MNLYGNSIECQNGTSDDKIIKLRGPIQEFTVALGAYSRGQLIDNL